MTGPTGAKRSPVENRSRRLRCLQDLDDPIDDRRDDKSRPPLRRRKIREGERYNDDDIALHKSFHASSSSGRSQSFRSTGSFARAVSGTALRRRALRNRMKSSTSPYVRGHGRPRSMLMVYWWFRVRRTWISRTALPYRRIPSATTRGTRKRGTGEMFISSGADVPVAVWPTVRSHFRSGLPPLVLGSVPPPPGGLLLCCIFAISLHRDSLRRIQNLLARMFKRMSQWSWNRQQAQYKRYFIEYFQTREK